MVVNLINVGINVTSPKQAKIDFFMDVEGTKDVKRLINLLAITVNLYHEIDADPSGSGS